MHKTPLFCGVIVALHLLFAPAAQAQTPATTSVTNTEATDSENNTSDINDVMKDFIARPLKAMELPKGTAAPFSSLIKQPPEGVTEDTTGVALNGYIRYVPYNDSNYVQAVIGSISRGDIEVPLSDQKAVNGQFETEKLVIETDDELPLKANPTVLNDALQGLAAAEADAEGEEEQTEESTPQIADTGSSTGSATGSSSDGSKSQYQAPQQQDFSDPTTEVKITEDGCFVRVDAAQNRAVQQVKSVTYEDGKVVSETVCEDSLVNYALQKSHDGCEDIVEIGNLIVYRQAKAYYNKDGAVVTVSGCEKDSSSTFAITEDTFGCAPIVDQAARRVNVYAKLVYTGSTNAGIVVRGCAISAKEPAYDLQKSYDSCGHRVELANRYAYAQYEDYYVNAVATRVSVSDCAVDVDKKWPITEVEGSCQVTLDFAEGNEQVFTQSVMQYTDDDRQINEARGCDKSSLTDPVPMVKDTALCSLRHDFTENESRELFLWKYTLNGIAYQASACSDSGVTYAHQQYTVDATGTKICTPNVSTSDMLVTLFYRVGIEVAGNVQYITECKPDSSNQLTVLATTDGCTDPVAWQHDLAAGVSYENERFYYDFNGKREYVTPCQQGDTTYRHNVEAIGWQHYDDHLYALPISKVTIDAPIGAYVVSVNTVLPGSVQQPYVLQETHDVVPDDRDDPNGAHVPDSYEGCTGLFATDRTEIYHRPDDTIFNKIVGEGDPVTEYSCIEVVEETRSYEVGYSFTRIKNYQTVQCTSHSDNRNDYTATYSAVRANLLSAAVSKYFNRIKYDNVIVGSAFFKTGSEHITSSGITSVVGSLSGECPSPSGVNKVFKAKMQSDLAGYRHASILLFVQLVDLDQVHRFFDPATASW